MKNVEQEVLQFFALKQKAKVVVMLHCLAHDRFSFSTANNTESSENK